MQGWSGPTRGTGIAPPASMQTTDVLGYHCSHEQHSPSALLRHARLAAEAGFAHAMCSDHFHPWSERQGHSGFTWSWLGAAMQATSMSFGTVCAPGQRYHPAVIAQAVGTLGEMFPDRLWLALGSGEALNEAITGDAWPSRDARNERLHASAEVMRALWRGETVSTRGPVTTVDARLYDRPATPPMIVGAALTAETAEWVAGWADALITVAGPRDDLRKVVDAFRRGGGEAKPMFLQVALAYAPTDDEAEAAAYDQWRFCALPPANITDLASVAAFDRATEKAERADVLKTVRASSDIDRQLAWLHEDRAMGFERLYLHNVARDHQERFIEACATRLTTAMA